MTAVLERPVAVEPETTVAPVVHSAAGLGIGDTVCTPEYTIGCMVLPSRERGMHLMWDSRNETEVALAASTFATHKAQGELAYKTDAKGSETISTFDPRAEHIVLARQIQGG